MKGTGKALALYNAFVETANRLEPKAHMRKLEDVQGIFIVAMNPKEKRTHCIAVGKIRTDFVLKALLEV